MDHAIVSQDVGDDDFSIIDEDLAVFNADGDLFAQKGLSFFQQDHIFSQHTAFHNMVEQDIGQGRNIF
jgi:hypothetical protein